MTEGVWVQVIVTVGVLAAAWITGRLARGTKKVEVESAPYDVLAERVSRLEAQVAELLSSQHEDRQYIRRLIAERPMGLPLPQPIPVDHCATLGRYAAVHHPAAHHRRTYRQSVGAPTCPGTPMPSASR